MKTLRNKPSLAVGYFSYTVVMLTTIAFVVFYQQSFYYLILALEVCLPFLSRQLTKQLLLHLEPEISFHPSTLSKDQDARLKLSIHNHNPFPVSSACITLQVSSVFYGGETTVTHVLPLRAKDANTLSFPVHLSKYGLYEACATQLVIYDYLHLFSFKKELDQKTTIRIMPDASPVQKRHDALHSEGFDEFEESQKSGNVSSNVTDIREYQPGDRLQKIHWKLSEKIQKLMVKENESTSTNQFFLLAELYQPSEETCEGNPILREALDATISEAWAVGQELVEAGEIFVFAIYSAAKEDFVMSTIRSQYDLENAFVQAFYEKSYETADLALSIYERSGLKNGTLLHITHEGCFDINY